MRYYHLLLATALLFTACKQPAKNNTSARHTNSVETNGSPDSNTITQAISTEKLIVPGKSVGETKLNEDADSVVKRLGQPDAGDAAMGKSLSVWYAKHDTSSYQTMVYAARQMGTGNEVSRVKQIRVTSPWFNTTEGLHTGSTLQEINKSYTTKKTATFVKGNEQFGIYESARGIAFEVDPNNVCKGIVIWDTASPEPGKTYLPFYKNLKMLK